MHPYTHTQIGHLMIGVAICVALLFSFVFETIPPEERFPVAVLMGCVLLIFLSFSTLTTVVDATHVRIRFGFGIFRKAFPLGEIASVQVVQNRWWYGWGVRVWFSPYMCIYNVSGFDAVEITMKNGRLYRIGTDVPQELEREIRVRMGERQ